jgi:hypothetical protein
MCEHTPHYKDKKMIHKGIWQTLSSIDCSNHVEKKNNLTYLSWAWAWSTLMEHYPEATFEFDEPKVMADGTMMVFCTVSINECSRKMWLPVMDYKNKAISNPDSFAVNTAMMRCLVKCLALYGLGHYIYAGEDVPQVHKPERKPDGLISQSIHAATNIDELRAVWKGLTPEQREAHGDVLAEVKERLA